MSNGIADSAVGAILEIPPQTLQDIDKAERAIKQLALTSAEAAGKVNDHWGVVAPHGLQKFIDKIVEAKKAMDGLGTINVTLNTQAAVQSTEQLSTATQRTSADVSKAVQDMAQSWDGLAGQAPKGFGAIKTELYSSIENAENTLKKIKELRDSVVDGERVGNVSMFGDTQFTRQELADIAKYLEANIKLWKDSTAAKNEALGKIQSNTDKNILSEQNQLLADRLKYQKKLNELESTEKTRTAKKGTGLTADESKQMDVYARKIDEINQKLVELSGKYGNLSEQGREAWRTNRIDNLIAKQEANIRLTEKEAEALARIKKEQESKTDKNILDEQKRLLTEQLNLRKRISDQKKIVESGNITDSSKLKEEEDALRKLFEQYRKNAEARRDLNRENLSTTGQTKFDLAEEKQRNELLDMRLKKQRELNSALAKANELTSVAQVSKSRIDSSDEARTLRQLNSDYKGMINVIREVGEIRAKAAAEGRSTNTEERELIATLIQRYRLYRDDIARISSSYANLAEARRKAYEQDHSEQLARNAVMLADAQNKAAEAAQKVADAQAKAAQQQADKDRSQAESELNRLYTERLRLLKEKEQLENKALVNNAKGLPDLTAKENQLLSELTAKLKTVDSQIQTIGNTYRGLQLKAQHAYELPELRQTVQLQNQLNDALKSVDTSNAKQLAAEYKRLTAEAQKLAQSMREYTAAGGDKNSAAYQQLEAQFRNIMMQRRIIEMQNVDDVNNYRQQRQTAAYQADLSAFVQAEAQKTAEAKRQAEQQSNDRIQAYQRFLNTYQGAMAAANKLGTRGGQWEDTYENRARVIKNLEAAIKSLNKADADYESKLKDLTDALKRLKDAQKEVNDVMKQKPQVTLADANQARKIAEQTKTLKDYETAYKLLIEVMKQTPQGRAWDAMNAKAKELKHNIDEIKKKMGEFQSQASKTSGLMGQLQGRIAAAFSIGAISGFIKKMVEVRAQFELQRVALGAIIQDRDEANKIFTQVQNMALESPFNIMQLEKATKQIAAFGFETKKLVPTMKMFADISAGLGVEIDRLVLVMGHLKARNFLEGCLGLGTPVKMADGSVKRVEDILQGESIMGDDDTPRIVKQIIRGNEQMYKVSYTDGSFRCNENHILTLYNVARDSIEDVYVLDYLKKPDTYKGVRRANRHFEYFDIAVEKDIVDNYYGFVIDGNRRFQLGDGTVTHNTMVRQFTNMGFNVLGELSKYYSELENKMVSVGEVQDRVKKKMVSFEDVEEVLKRVTSAGGMFYDMQKKQSESLWGQMQRIKDAYDLMLNEIGQSNEGTLKSALTFIRTLINHWRTLAPIIQATGAAIAVYFAVSRFSAIAAGVGSVVTMFKNMKVAIMEVNAAQQTLNATQKANAWGLLASLIIAATVAIYEYATAQSQLNESMDRVRNEGIGNMYDLIYQYQKLADTVRDTNKPYEEQKKALDEIKRIYADILPAELLEIKNIKEMSDGYERATEAIKAYSAEKIKSNLKAEIENIVGKEIQSEGNDLADWFAVFAERWDLLPEKMPVDTFRSMVKTMIAEISEEVKNGEIPVDSAFDELKKHMQDRLKNLMPKDALDQLFERIESRNKGWGETYFEDWEESLQKFQDQINGIDIGFEGAESERLVVAKNQYEDLTKAVDEYKKAIEALRIAKENGKVEGDVSQDANGNFTAKNDGQEGQKALDNLSQAYKKLQGQVEEYGVTWTTTSKDINAAIESQTGQMNYFEQTNEKVFIRVLSGFSRWQKEYREDDSVKAWVERTLREADKLDLSSVQNKILDVALSVTSANGMQTKSLDKLRLASLNSFGDAAKAAQSVYNQLAQNEIAIQTQIKSLVRYGYSAAQAKMMAEEQYGAGMTVEEIKEMMELYKELIPAFGGTFKDPNKSKSKSDKELKRWQGLKKAIEDVTTAYDKYRKSFSVEESNKRIEELYAPVFKELNSDIKQFYKDGKYDTEAMIKALEVLKGLTNATTEERKKFRSEIERKIGVSQVEIEVKLQEDAERKLKADIDEMFANYELTKELNGLGVPVELMFMLGGKPTDLDKLKKQLQTEFEAIGGKAAPENVVKAYEDSFKKIADLENKQRQQQLKNYIKYLTESMGERAQIEIKALQDINKIENDATLDAFSKQQAVMQRRKKMQEELTKFDLDELKSSDVYISVFKDLETASKEQLQYVIDKLKETQTAFSDLSPAQVKSIANDLKKFESALASKDSVRNLFSNIKTSIEYAKKRNDLLKEQTQTQEDVNDSTKELSDAQVRLTNLQLKLKSIQDESSDEWKEANAAVEAQQRLVKELQDKIAELEEKLKKLTGEIEDGESAWEGWRKGINNIRNGMNQVKDSLDAVFDGLDSMGLVNDTFRDTYESIGDIVGGLGTFMDGLASIDMKNPFSIIIGSIKAIGGIAQTIGAAFGIGDKKKEREIQRLTEKVETLDKAYQNLEKSIEAAYTFSDYNAGFKKMQQSLDAQKQAYEEMIRLEEAKKKSDDDKVKEYKDKLEEIAEAEKELYEKRHEMYGSTNDVWDEANNWVDAWLDAYKETGDGLDALNDSWDEFYENLVKKQAASKVLGARMDSWIKQINDAIDRNMGSEYDYIDLFKQIGEKMKADFDATNADLKKIFEYAGIGGGAGSLILSDLQKGIQNITEPQAAAIEAYLNSMRFAVFEHTRQLDTLIATIQMQYGSGAENPVVTELKGIRSVLDSINSKFDSIIGKNGFQSAIRIVS